MTTTNEVGVIDLENWIVEACEDDDSLLNVYLHPKDGTGSHETETDICRAVGDEVHLRFTSEKIEEAYLKQLEE
jgi:hypothetical protein